VERKVRDPKRVIHLSDIDLLQEMGSKFLEDARARRREQRLQYFRKMESVASQQPDAVQELNGGASFGGDLDDLTILRHHALRALCGFLMDRHTACRSPHPFCAIVGHQKNEERPQQLIAAAIPQRSPVSSDHSDIIGIYLCRAMDSEQTGEEQDIMKSITEMVPADPAPHRKLVVSAPQDDTYTVAYGPILNPVEGDYFTGSVDPTYTRVFKCNPEPRHCRWQYWESALSKGDRSISILHCLQVFGEWWVVEIDPGYELAQRVAALALADNPEHNSGIHERPGIYARVDDGSEFSKVIKENLPPLPPF